MKVLTVGRVNLWRADVLAATQAAVAQKTEFSWIRRFYHEAVRFNLH